MSDMKTVRLTLLHPDTSHRSVDWSAQYEKKLLLEGKHGRLSDKQDKIHITFECIAPVKCHNKGFLVFSGEQTAIILSISSFSNTKSTLQYMSAVSY